MEKPEFQIQVRRLDSRLGPNSERKLPIQNIRCGTFLLTTS
jgi:hypothetical protein